MRPAYPHLLAPLKIGRFVLKNRMQSSNSMPHFSQGPETYPADALLSHYMGRARTGAAFVTFAGIEDTFQMPPLPDSLDVAHFPGFDARDPQSQNYIVELTEGMHAVGSLISGSLFSANRVFRYENEHGEVEAIDLNPKRPQAGVLGMKGSIGDDVPQEFLFKAILSYGQRTALYKRLGFDAVTIHMSYRAQVPGQLLSPLTNLRTDDFGGNFENRARFALMMLKEVKRVAGDDMLVEIQFSAEEPQGGYTFEEGLDFLRLAEPYVDIVQVRAAEANPNHPIPFELNPTPFLETAARVKAAGLDFAVSNVGGFFDPAAADAAIAEGKLDLVAMARAWISNPNYGDLVAEDRADDIVPCLRCNKCHGRGKDDVMTTTCSVNPHFGLEAVDRYLGYTPFTTKKVAVVGGGPGGMRCAIWLAERGHEVTIFEAESELGGAIRHADYVDFKWTLRDYKDYLIHQVKKLDIDVRLNTRATPETMGDDFDTVVVAVGAEPIIPAIPGADGPNTILATDAIMHADAVGEKVVVIGGGEVGVECGMFLAQEGRDVTVIEMRDELAADSTMMHYRSMFQRAWESTEGFHYVLSATAKAIEADHVTYVDAEGKEHEIAADTVVLSVGMRPKTDEALSFYGTVRAFWMVGDCVKPGTIQTTNRSAWGVARNV